MKRLIAVLLCVLFPVVAFASDSNSYKVAYDGGSLQGIKAGNSAKLIIEPTQILIVRDKQTLVTIPAASVTEISYGQDVHRRVGAAIGLAVFSFGLGALLALSKSKKHYVGIIWANGAEKGGFAMQCDKNDYRGVLTALEGITGKHAVDSDAMTVKN
ncbi:MAG: hypothetical protein WBY53_07980 [Acidobacteriaceae bacterium]